MPRPLSQAPIRAADGATTTAIPHGSLSSFYGGIETRIGVASLDFYEQMRKEHCEYVGCDYEFTSSNYTISTCPKKEWLLVTEGQDDPGDTVHISDSKSVRRRTPAHWWDHLKPASSSGFLFNNVRDPKDRSKIVLKSLSERLGLLIEEVIGIVLFTGPMFTAYNSVLSKFPPDIANSFAPINFTTTIHTIISAIQKLSIRTPVQSIVYRGTGGRGFLPDCFWDPQEGLNVYGYTEFGVMSMTSSKDVAIEYSGVLRRRPHPAILAFAAGAIDRGANVQELSQFPLEVEFTFPPLSYIQPEFVDGTHRIEYVQHPEAPDVDIPVIFVRVNANIRSPTLDELNSARKKNHIAFFRSQNRDTAAEILKIFHERREEDSLRFGSKQVPMALLWELKHVQHSTTVEDPVKTAFDGFASVICHQCESVLNDHQQKHETEFLDKFEHSRLLSEMLLVRKWAVAKMLWYIEDENMDLAVVMNYPLLKSYREYISFSRRQIQKEPSGAARKARALFLCRMLGLVGASDSNCNISPCDNGKSIIEAVENGMSTHDVELLLDAGYNVESTNAAGSSLLSIAARYGYLQLCELLIRRGADVNFVNSVDKFRSPLMFAASNDHLSCLQLLLDNGATPSSEALQEAKNHGSVDCFSALTEAGAFLAGDLEKRSKHRMLSSPNIHQDFSANTPAPLDVSANSIFSSAPVRTFSRSSSTRIQITEKHSVSSLITASPNPEGPKIARITPAHTMHKGWLCKKGRHTPFESWKRRFFVLDSVKKELSYYKDEADHGQKLPRNSWSLIGYAIIEDLMSANTFKLSGVGLRKYVLQAESSQELSEWLALLNGCVHDAHQNIVSSAATAPFTLPGMSMSGWLNKHGTSLLKNWNRRFFVLNTDSMEVRYYIQAEDHRSNRDPQGRFSLVNYSTVAADTSKDNSFKLLGVGCKTYHLQAESLIEQQEWISKLGRLLQSGNRSFFQAVDEGAEKEQQFECTPLGHISSAIIANTASVAASSATTQSDSVRKGCEGLPGRPISVYMSGWLNKQGGTIVKNWKRRFFVVDADTMEMHFYIEAADHTSKKEPRRSFPLANYTVSADAIKENSFKLSGIGCRTYYMQAENPKEQQEWMTKLRHLLLSAPPSSLQVVDEDHEVEEFFGAPGHRPGGKVGMEDFDMKKVIGRGAFGKVMLVQKKSDKKLYAMKILSKDMILRKKQVGRTQSENRILRKIDHPYLVGMKYAFQAETKLYLVLDYVNGGDLFGHLQVVKRFNVDQVRLYAAEMVLAFEYLHSLNIVYRDLKPENILVCFDGHLKLTDFGLVKENMSSESKTGSFCGTPEYLAPEVIASDQNSSLRYEKGVDWWALGILMFEMLVGRSPFFDDDTHRMYDMITNMPLEEALCKVPASIIVPDELRAILHAFLSKKPSQRLGFGPDDAQPVKAHAFFAPIDWEALERREIPSPYRPKVKDETNTSNFDKQFTSEPVMQTHVDPSQLTSSFQEQFTGFSYEAEKRLGVVIESSEANGSD